MSIHSLLHHAHTPPQPTSARMTRTMRARRPSSAAIDLYANHQGVQLAREQILRQEIHKMRNYITGDPFSIITQLVWSYNAFHDPLVFLSYRKTLRSDYATSSLYRALPKDDDTTSNDTTMYVLTGIYEQLNSMFDSTMRTLAIIDQVSGEWVRTHRSEDVPASVAAHFREAVHQTLKIVHPQQPPSLRPETAAAC